MRHHCAGAELELISSEGDGTSTVGTGRQFAYETNATLFASADMGCG
jgi:hypothetical protein